MQRAAALGGELLPASAAAAGRRGSRAAARARSRARPRDRPGEARDQRRRQRRRPVREQRLDRDPRGLDLAAAAGLDLDVDAEPELAAQRRAPARRSAPARRRRRARTSCRHRAARSRPASRSANRPRPSVVRSSRSSWARIGWPSRVSLTSNSTQRAPSSCALRRLASVFSGAAAAAPRCPITGGRAGSPGVLIERLAPIVIRPQHSPAARARQEAAISAGGWQARMSGRGDSRDRRRARRQRGGLAGGAHGRAGGAARDAARAARPTPTRPARSPSWCAPTRSAPTTR